MIIKRGISKAVDAAVEELKKNSRPIESKEAIAQVASISAADETIGELIAEAMEKVGKDGVITVEESNTFGTTLDVVEGMQFDRGCISLYMVTDTEKMEAVLEILYTYYRQENFNVQELLLDSRADSTAGKEASHYC